MKRQSSKPRRLVGESERGLQSRMARTARVTLGTAGLAMLNAVAAPCSLAAQDTTAQPALEPTCAGLLSSAPAVSAIGPSATSDTANNSAVAAGAGSPALGNRAETASFGVGGAQSGKADVVLWVGVHANQVTFAKQPNVRVRLCWGGDTLRVLQRQNIPSPVVAGTTYRNVYVAVELIGRVNAECLADKIGLGTGAQTSLTRASNAQQNSASTSASSCGFLGGSVGAGAQAPRPPNP